MKQLFIYVLFILITFSGCKVNHITDNPPDDNGNSSIITNGDFESSVDNKTPDNWLETIVGSPSFNYFSIDKTTKQSGSNSLKVLYIDSLSHPDSVSGAWGGLYQVLALNNISVGTQYYLKFWTNVNRGKFQIRLLKNGDNQLPLLYYVAAPDSNWQQKTIAFQIDKETNFLWILISTKATLSDNGIVEGWLDNMSISSKP